MKGRVLIIAGSDSGGGAGIQGDIKAVTCCGAYAATAITALTAQNSQGVFGIEKVSPAFIAKQIRVVLDDIGTDCIKTGMLHNARVIKIVAETLKQKAPSIPLIVDPVMIAKGGAALLEKTAINALKKYIIPCSMLVTPNIPEAELLADIRISFLADMEKAGHIILEQGAQAVLVKGGHLEGRDIFDILITPQKTLHFKSTRIATRHTHGTGCALASSIAAYLARNFPLETAVVKGRDYVRNAISAAPGLGQGNGPLEHAWILKKP